MKVIGIIVGVVGVVAAVGAGVWWLGSAQARLKAGAVRRVDAAVEAVKKAEFVGRGVCAECHEAEEREWRGSHHDLAMQEATEGTVLGDFGGARFEYHGVVTTFSRRDGGYFVTTDGADGALHEFKVAYTFGVFPLQQYLIEFPNGRYQALNVCWDARSKEEGGGRWFHLYPNERVGSSDILHWTGPYQNWNHMCAECHSTAVHKNYDAEKDAFKTAWSELNVSCEACHGPGSGHVEWARKGGKKYKEDAGSTMGLVALLREEKPGVWTPDAATGIAKRDHARTSVVEQEMCARCHSRRGTFNEDVLVGKPPGDTHRLALLEPGLYEADGQIRDEVYEYGSFLQSRMHAAGVTCSDCHNAHTLKVPGGNMTCARCHEPAKFDTPEHHFHKQGGEGAGCVACHMPSKKYMVVHERHDHGFRVPRPDLTESIGTPNVCNGCHADRSAGWAKEEIAKRRKGKQPGEHFGVALAAGRNGAVEAEALLRKLVADGTQPGIARASAAAMLAGGDVSGALKDADPLVRGAAVNAAGAGSAEALKRLLAGMLKDPVRQIRMDAARRLVSLGGVEAADRGAMDAAMAEYEAAQRLDADRPEGRVNLGALYAERGEQGLAEREYRAAIRLCPQFPGAYVNLADLYREQRREEEAIRVLREGMEKATGSADIPHALGLALVRAGRLEEALPLLEQAARLAPDATRYAYVYGVALETAGPAGRGLEVLKAAHERRRNDAEVLGALVAYCQTAGRKEEARAYAEKLVALRPGDVDAKRMLESLGK